MATIDKRAFQQLGIDAFMEAPILTDRILRHSCYALVQVVLLQWLALPLLLR